MTMFRRKSKNETEDNICPYCEFVNAASANICSQCYYQLEKSARDQGEPISTEVSGDIFDIFGARCLVKRSPSKVYALMVPLGKRSPPGGPFGVWYIW